MTDERVDPAPQSSSSESVEPDEDRRRELRDVPSSPAVEPVLTLIAFVVGNFSSAFIQALGQQAAGESAKLPKRVRDLVKKRVRRKDEPDEYRIGVRDGSAATIVVTEDTPDDARLALLDLDVTADELRGKLLRWDSGSSSWRPADDQ